MGLLEGIADAFPQIFQNKMLIYGIVGLMILIIFFYLRRGEIKTNMKVFYFAEVESLVSPLDVKKLTPKSVYTKDDKRFMRRAKSWLYKFKGTSFVVWLAKVGSGITYSIERNKTDDKGKEQVVKIGSLLEGIENCLQIQEPEVLKISDITEDALDKLKKSEIFVCVDLEEHTKDLPDITEEGAVTEANKTMMELVGLKIKQTLKKEDWIRNAGMMAIGALAYVLAQQLGIL